MSFYFECTSYLMHYRHLSEHFPQFLNLLSFADVDECAAGIAVCPRFRKCINTFGSYICKCHEGFDLQYINGKYQCIGTVAAPLL